jgi:preprotein translocase subunit YajC
VISAAPAASGSGNGFLPVLFLVGLLALMYFMVIRPQSRRRKQMQRMQEDLSAGTAVITIGGLYGTIVAMDDESATLEVAPGVTNRYARGAIARVVPADDAADDGSGGSNSPAVPTLADGADVAPSEGPGVAEANGKELR